MTRGQRRLELLRLVKVYALLTALLEVQEPNIGIRRKLEQLEATSFTKRSSIQVEMSREMVQTRLEETWEQIEVMIDLIASRSGSGDGER